MGSRNEIENKFVATTNLTENNLIYNKFITLPLSRFLQRVMRTTWRPMWGCYIDRARRGISNKLYYLKKDHAIDILLRHYIIPSLK